MRDLHDGFAAWVADGTRDELPRDLAVHASGCDGCIRQTAAFDALESVDIGAAPPPPIRAAPIRHVHGPLQLARAAGGALVVVIVLGTGAMAGSTLFGSRVPSPSSSPVDAAETPAEGVLSGVPSSTPSPTPSPSSEPSPSPSPTVPATPAVALATPRPTMGGGPPPIATARPATPAPVQVTPPPATPAPTETPTTAPTPSPPASPTAAPTPPTPPPPTPPPPTPVPSGSEPSP